MLCVCVCFVFTYKGRPDTQVRFDAQQKAGSVVLNLLSGIFFPSLYVFTHVIDQKCYSQRAVTVLKIT